MDRKKAYALMAFYFGSRNQMVVAIEEMSELQKELAKFLRGKGRYKAVVEELADAMVMLEQIKCIFAVSDDELEKAMNEKVMRTLKRLQKGEQ